MDAENAPGKQKVLSVNARVTLIGGAYFTPIDLPASIERGEEVRLDDRPFSQQTDPVFRTDLGLIYRINKQKTTQSLKMEIQNITNNDTVVEQYYNNYGKKIIELRQWPLLPVIFYSLSF